MSLPPDPAVLDRYRPFIRMRVRQLELNPRLRGRVGESDLVGEAVLRAVAGWAGFRGRTEAELLGWLQCVVHDVYVDAVRHHTARKRDIGRENLVRVAHDESSASLAAYFGADSATPSREAARREQLLRLAATIDDLPANQRDVVILHYLLGCKLGEIAGRLGKPEGTVAYWLFLARKTLKSRLADPGDVP